MGIFNGCDRILKEDVCLENLYLKTMDNQLSNYSVTSIKSRHYCLCTQYICIFFKTPAIFFPAYKDLIFYILNVCIPVDIHNITKPAFSINIFYRVPNFVFYLKCYNLPFFGWRYGNVDNYSLLLFFGM